MPPPAPNIRRAVGLRDIAEQLGISVSFVSKVLSGRLGTSSASPEMVQAIHAKAKELRYRKNRLAEALKMGRQNAIAVCIHRVGVDGSGLVDNMLRGLAAEVGNSDRRLLIRYVEDNDAYLRYCREIDRALVDGFIIAGVAHPEIHEELQTIRRRGVPIISLHDQPVHDAIPNIGVDQTQVGRLATQHLIERGCRNIAHFIPPKGTLPPQGAPSRYEGYCRALADAGIPQRRELIVDVDAFDYPSGCQGAQELIRRGVAFDGICAQSDHHAIGALNYLITHGKRVPDDVKIIGVDDAPFCPLAVVPLSSVSQEFESRGRLVVQKLADMIDGRTIQNILLEPVVRPRQSTN